MSLASRTRCQWSTAIRACGRAARTPEAYGADGSMTTTAIPARNAALCSPSQVRTQAPDRPGAKPNSIPGPVVSASTNEVIHGSVRRHPVCSRSHRTLRARVSSMPNTRVGGGGGSHRTAAAINAACAVCHATAYSLATSATARFDPAIAVANAWRSRLVSRDRSPISTLAWVNERRGHCSCRHSSRRLRHHSATCWPDAGRSLIRTSGRSLTRQLSCPQSGHAASTAIVSITTWTISSVTRTTSTTRKDSRPNSKDVGSSMLVASLLSVVEDSQHAEATSLIYATTPRSSAENH